MLLKADDYQIAAFFGLIIIFEICERIWPARPVDRWLDFKLDALSFAFALTVNRVSTWAIRSAVGDVTPRCLAGTVHYLQNLPSAVKIILALFIVDFLLYWIHRAQHNHNLMWRTHAWHHSVEQMYWFAGFRTSFFHSFIYNIPQVVIPVTLFKLTPAEAGIGYSIGLLIQFWEHTNLNVNIGPLKWLIVTPDYHRIHHSATTHRGMNLAPTFRIWDRMFGTYVDPASMPKEFPLGLGEHVERKQVPRMLVGI
jgi:sterol desaturase/sphingolipid hydroxylase (fatty acid hydroxylase superfamily)